VLVALDLDMSLALLKSAFSETIRLSTFAQTKIALDVSSAQLNPIQLRSASVSSVSLIVVQVQLHADDCLLMQFRDDIERSKETIVTSIASTLVKDMNDNAVTSLAPASARAASSYQTDAVLPFALGFNLNTNTATTTITFSEIVRVNTVGCTSLTLSTSAAMSIQGDIAVYLLLSTTNGLEVYA
jgi:hypothetical protein